MAVTPEEVCQMEQWYVLKAVPGREQEGADLIKRAVIPGLWEECQVLRKVKVFRSGGALRFPEEVMFPGYVFVKTSCPQALAGELRKTRDFPQFFFAGVQKRGRGYGKIWENGSAEGTERYQDLLPDLVPLEKTEILFLQDVCGENLQNMMGISYITLNSENRIIRVDGILEKYLDRIVRVNLHKRFALVEAPLFNRAYPILFGICLEKDRAVRAG